MTALLLGVTGCGSDAGAAVRPADTPVPSAAVIEQKSTLAGLIALPRGYVADPKHSTGPFGTESYIANFSAEPALDRALLLNAGLTEGYRASRLSPDKKKRYVIQLFKVATPAKAKILQDGFWSQEPRNHPFRVPGALSNAHASYDAGTEKNEAIAEASIVVGSLVALLSVRQSAPLGTSIRPDTALIADLAVRQRARLTSNSS
ncbi:hypothetical protein GCM10029976_044230 [Kribbella albertanoniae]|uniref:DUF3558 domain-containing protein n=1 Tax=Kribbella albertanoniae TaxID=1266829 RepID=A0A4R4PMN2_9ACTN|nr:hypothetical protein [Kribbella albertanoniae]TDC23431.1 hypothetical protein E1261_28410 [Kribbella albertanoniae]